MHPDKYPASRHDATWREVLLEAAVTVIAFALVTLAVRLFCWSFFIPFHSRYAAGVILTVIMAKWLFLKNHK
jgi:hypothetical protein